MTTEVRVDAVKVNEWLLKAASKYVRVFEDHVISVTEATFPCLRAAYYRRTRKALPTPIEALKILGSELHLMLQDVMKSEGWETEVGVGIELDGFKLVGRADAVKYNTRGEAEEVIEIKTSNGLHEEALNSHMLQLQAYLTILHARRGYLIYVDRASGRVKVFKVLPNKQALRQVIQRAKELHEALRNHEPPPRTRGPWCNICPYRRACFRRW